MSGADELDEAIALANGASWEETRRKAGRSGPGAPRRAAGSGERSRTEAPADPPLAHAEAHDVPWPDARAYAARAASPLPARELPLEKALNHTLHAPLDALTDLPSFDTSAMDGWAVAGPGPWTLPRDAGRGILAGARSEPAPLADGDAVPIATGARIPPGAGAVLRSEYGETDGRRLRATRPPQPGADIRPRGQECRSGDRLLPTGTPVTPAVLGLAAAAGYDRLSVTRRPRAEVLVLGDELLHRGVPSAGRIRDALGPAVGPWLEELGAEVIVTRRLGDDAEALYEAAATTTADVLVTTGGTARGPVDHLRPTLARLGARLLIEGVRVRPGHPMLLARLPLRSGPDAAGEATGDEASGTGVGASGTGVGAPAGTPRGGGSAGGRGRDASRAGGTGGLGSAAEGPFLVGLPGNPLAALSGLATLAAPLIRSLGDRPSQQKVTAPITDDVQGHPRDTRLVPVDFSPSPARARPLHYNGPAMLRGIATATALAVVPPGGVSAGAGVQVLPLPWAAR